MPWLANIYLKLNFISKYVFIFHAEDKYDMKWWQIKLRFELHHELTAKKF